MQAAVRLRSGEEMQVAVRLRSGQAFDCASRRRLAPLTMTFVFLTRIVVVRGEFDAFGTADCRTVRFPLSSQALQGVWLELPSIWKATLI